MNPAHAAIGVLLPAVTTFAQAGAGPYSPPPLPAPPVWERWLFENPWPLVIGLCAAAVVIFFISNARAGAARGVQLAMVLIALAAGSVLSSFLVTTERERLITQTERLIAATATADTPELAPMLASDVSLTVLDRPFSADKDGILGLVTRYMGGQIRVKEHSTSGASAHVTRSGNGQSLIRVRVVADAAGFSDTPNRSWWRITWRKNAEGEWTAVHIEGLQIDMVKGSMIPAH